MRIPLLVLAFAACIFAQAPATPKTIVRGVVRALTTGSPLPDVMIRAYSGDRPLGAIRADSEGRFELKDAEPGGLRLIAAGTATSMDAEILVDVAGKEVNVEIRAPGRSSISGRVVDQNDEPAAGFSVLLIDRNYSHGSLRYIVAGFSGTNSNGEYTIGATAGRAHLLQVRRRAGPIDAISEAPEVIQNRKPAFVPTFYPGADSPEGGQTIVLRTGEQRDHVDLRVLRTSSYCVEGVLQPGSGVPQEFELMEHEPQTGRLGGPGSTYYGIETTRGKTDLDGKIRVCDLHPGDYDLKVRQSDGRMVTYYSNVPLHVTDLDLAVSVNAAPRAPVAGEIVWAEARGAPDATVTIQNGTPEGMTFLSEGQRTAVKVPGRFSFDNLLMKEYLIELAGLTNGAYIKDMTYGGNSIRYESLRPGTAVGNGELRITLGHDGGTVTVAARDKDGKPMADLNVMVAPASMPTDALLAAAMVSGKTSQNGAWTSPALAPGKYLAIATRQIVDRSPETIARIKGALTKWKEIDLGGGQNASVTISEGEIVRAEAP